MDKPPEAPAYDYERALATTLLFGAINYCFTQPYTKRAYRYQTKDQTTLYRSTALLKALYEADVEWECFDQVRQLRIEEWHCIVQTSDDRDLFDLNERLRRLQKFSAYLSKHNTDNVEKLISVYHNADSLLKLLVESKLFEDEFFKRAQLTIAQIDRLMRQYGKPRIRGVDKFTIMADYRLPQLLYNCAVLRFNPFGLNSPLLAANAVQQIRSRRVNWLNTPLLAAEIVNSRICFI